MRHAVRCLRSSGCPAGGKRVDDSEHLIRPGLGHGREQLASAVVTDRNLDARVDVARI